MDGSHHQDISRFAVAGINYKKTDAEIRGQFAVSPASSELILAASADAGVNEVFILSTCNRTEIYGIAADPSHLVELLCRFTEGDEQTFRSRSYIKEGAQAIEHLFHVGAGLDSQILGDYEIVGQIKQAVKFSKERGRIGTFVERLVNSVLQSSKTIKNQTALSGGTVSVSFTAVQYIQQNVRDLKKKKILLLGTGKIGRNTCKNLVDYLPTTNITLINRTDEKAAQLATSLGLLSAPYAALKQEIRAADIILVATNAPTPTVLAEDLSGSEKLLIDLSIPYNVEPSAKNLQGITLINVDELSSIKDKTLYKRKAEVPKAIAIVADHIREFMEWYDMRRHVPVLRAVKHKLQEIHGNPVFFSTLSAPYGAAPLHADHHERIQKVINGMAVKMRLQNQKGCHYIEAINEFMTPAVNSL